MRLILPILITLIFSLQTYAMDKNSNSFIRVLLGDKRPSSNELEKIKKLQQKPL